MLSLIFVSFTILIILIYKMEEFKKDLYILILEIPIKNLKSLTKQTEDFLNNLKNKNGAIEFDKDEALKITSMNTNNLSFGILLNKNLVQDIQRNRKYKNKSNFFKNVIICFFFVICVFLSYYLLELYYYNEYRSRGMRITPAFSGVIKVSAPLYSLMNAIR